jgi:hypothetical protein
MHKSATKCNETIGKWCKNKHGASKIIDTFETYQEVVGTTNGFRVPIPCKLVGIHDALEKNFNWIRPENLFDESCVPKNDHKGSSKTHLDTIQFIVEKTPMIDLNASFYIT